MSVVVVRHGETAWALQHRHTGRADIPLTEAGRADAAALAAMVAAWTFDLVLVSPLLRAVTTAELIGVLPAAERVDDLMEWDYGTAEGHTREDVRAARPGWTHSVALMSATVQLCDFRPWLLPLGRACWCATWHAALRPASAPVQP